MARKAQEVSAYGSILYWYRFAVSDWVYASVISPFGFVALLAAAAAAYFGSARLHVEYEYVFVTNELAIDRILSQRTTQAYEEAGHPENRKNGFHEVT